MLGPQPFSLLQVKRRETKARESALPTIFEQSKEKNYPPTSLVTSALYLFVCWEGLTLALCAHRVDAGERVGAQGMETPRYSSCVLIGLSSPRGSVAERFSQIPPRFFFILFFQKIDHLT